MRLKTLLVDAIARQAARTPASFSTTRARAAPRCCRQRAPRQRPAGAGHPARDASTPLRSAWISMLGAMSAWREPGRRAGDGEDRRRLRRGAQAQMGLRGDRSSTRSRLRRSALHRDREPRRPVAARARGCERRRRRRPSISRPRSAPRLDFASITSLATRRKRFPLPGGAPFGALAVNKQTCTLCKACIGACPESALIDATGDAEPALHRAQLRAMRPCASTPAPRTRLP